MHYLESLKLNAIYPIGSRLRLPNTDNAVVTGLPTPTTREILTQTATTIYSDDLSESQRIKVAIEHELEASELTTWVSITDYQSQQKIINIHETHCMRFM